MIKYKYYEDSRKLGSSIFSVSFFHLSFEDSIVVIRTPYGMEKAFHNNNCFKLLKGGYNVMIEDVRGRYNSSGDFQLFNNEKEDSFRLTEWIRKRQYTGSIILYGTSYEAFCALAAASTNKEISGVVSIVGNGQSSKWIINNNIYNKSFLITWISSLAFTNKLNYDVSNYYIDNHVENLARESFLNALNEYVRKTNSMITLGIELNLDEVSLDDIECPIIWVNGLFDIFSESSFEQFTKKRNKQIFIHGPWEHSNTLSDAIPGLPVSHKLVTKIPNLLQIIDQIVRDSDFCNEIRWYDLYQEKWVICDDPKYKKTVIGCENINLVTVAKYFTSSRTLNPLKAHNSMFKLDLDDVSKHVYEIILDASKNLVTIELDIRTQGKGFVNLHLIGKFREDYYSIISKNIDISENKKIIIEPILIGCVRSIYLMAALFDRINYAPKYEKNIVNAEFVYIERVSLIYVE